MMPGTEIFSVAVALTLVVMHSVSNGVARVERSETRVGVHIAAPTRVSLRSTPGYTLGTRSRR